MIRARCWMVLVAAVAGCTGSIGDPPEPKAETAEALCAKNGPMPGPMPRFVRLTHEQYDNTVRDLLHLDTSPSDAFIGDPTFAGFSNNAEGLVVSDRLARDYRKAAEELAGAVATSPQILAELLPCQPAGDGSECTRQLVKELGRLAYRQPLDAATEDAYVALAAGAAGLYDTGTPFEQGIRLVIEGMLQSPHFLYRVELSDALEGEIIPLSGFEIASRLSYLLWNSAPDEALLAAAESGALGTPEGIEAEARRLLADPRSTGPVDDFHAQWLDMSRYEDLTKDPAAFPGWSPDLADDMKAETAAFIRHVIFEEEADFAALMSEPSTFVNADLAAVYGLPGSFGPELQKVELDPTQRAGILTQLGFLSSHAFFNTSSPIHRGVFIQRRILCATLPDPPGNVDTTLPPVEGEIKTTRQAVEVHTSPASCAPCHDKINPSGFAFENYDAIGQWRTTDNGEPVDATGSAPAGDGELTFAGAIDFVGQIAESPAAERCYLTQWFRYGYGRQETAVDACTIDALDLAMQEKGYNIKELLVALTQTKTFRYRAVEEVGK